MWKKTMEVQGLVAKQTSTGLALAREFFSTQEEGPSNLVFSPLSFHVLLSMLASGTSSPARDEILDFLNAGSIDELLSLFSDGTNTLVTEDDDDDKPLFFGPTPKMLIANGVWLDKSLPLRDSFKEVVNNVYKGSFFPADFINEPEEVESSVNRWVMDKTKGLIDQIIAPGQLCGLPRPRLVMANALYLKAAWEDKFEVDYTKEEDFFLPDNRKIRVPLMDGGGMKRVISVFDGFKALGLPYGTGTCNSKFWMYFFLPESSDGLPALAKRIFSGPESLDRYIPRGYTRVRNLKIPKFKMSYEIEATEILKGMGMEQLFSPGGLNEMLENGRPHGDLSITKVYHKSFIEVKEQGTEASAVTVAVDTFGCGLCSEPPVDFVADHPFLFLIREQKTKIVLFIGQVINPLIV